MNTWLLLLLAGFFEVLFTSFLKLSDGFTKLPYVVGFLVFGGISFYLLSQVMLKIPLGTAYAVWTGIGVLGTAIVGFVFFKDPVSLKKILLLSLLISSIIGLKAVSE